MNKHLNNSGIRLLTIDCPSASRTGAVRWAGHSVWKRGKENAMKTYQPTFFGTDTHARLLNHSDGKCKQATIVEACLLAGGGGNEKRRWCLHLPTPPRPPISDHFWSLFNEAKLFSLPLIVLPFKSPPKPSTRQLMRRNILVNYLRVADRNPRAKRAIKRNESFGFCDRNEFLISPFPVIWQL